ncbi:efflux RND transporter periplasmic adaptor subunit [Altericroceibacterium spongiae]|uniref:Efflux RND transporter periplasmic adaptor subunit n=1 Tax=Altericroceibacterium spongiae TaxID=2320269 RepID=A0A420EQV7_9SPHN|nr:efflux RND transporter periplasmic adaptor subunit [Altericroceibacterium spongiae]RKF23030.1 efflux RND transporter periplasmic adaptor subunit [Altericroceibacterium spongiae]
MIDTGSPDNLDDLLDARPATSRQRKIIWAIVVVAVAVLAFLMLRFFTGHDTPYILHKLERGTLQPQLTATGTVHAVGELQVRAPFAGLVSDVLPGNPKRVTKGQFLARMDAGELQARLEELKGRTDTAKAAVETATAALSEAQAQLSRMERVYRESDGRVPSRGELEVARAEVTKRKSEVDLARSQMAEAEGDLSATRKRIAASIIRSPVSGFLITKQAHPGYVATAPGDVLFVIASNMEQLEIPITAEDTVVEGLNRGAPAKIRLDTLPDEDFTGEVKRITPEPSKGNDTDISAQQLIVAVNNQRLAVNPGMKASVSVDLPPRENVFLVPNGAFHVDPATERPVAEAQVGHATIFLLNGDDAVKPVDVVVGASDGQFTEVRSPRLSSGDLVISGWRSAPADETSETGGNAN